MYVLKKSDEFHKCNFCYKQFAFKSTMYKHQVSHQINSKPITPYQYLPIYEPDIDLQEFMEDTLDEDSVEDTVEDNEDYSYLFSFRKNVNLFAEWDVNDQWQSLRDEEAAMEKYLNKKK